MTDAISTANMPATVDGLIPHPRYYFDDPAATLLLRVEGFAFKLYRALVLNDCVGLRQLLEMPQDSGISGDAVVDLGDTTKAELESYLHWKCHNANEELHADAQALDPVQRKDLLQRRERFCVDLLEFSRRWIVEGPQVEAAQALQTCRLTAVRRLQLARAYGLRSWIRPAAREIIRIGIRGLSLADVEAMGPEVFRVLAQAREGYLEALQDRLYTAPRLESDPAFSPEHDHSVCQEVWKEFWWSGIARKTMAPYDTLSEWAYSEYVRSKAKALESSGMHQTCVNYIADRMDDGSAFAVDHREEIYNAAALAIETYLA
ncbi:hypothetical protein K523DRAFT_356110 [Schizophyllum commune Tattone D]|nr:hypothetical protein K523DRAFT_356110 [Schizophyllum commune Tattone D]